ncbi:putative meiosis-specific topoisomerase Spo11 [Aspergillus affinis]|uniref:putative meiosis-specific topoisomerase Spo11 n=1 Tax=Aspergillus affinis TaxID=1070780 RepID=UPI0022FDB609|nr:meiotic recombination protein spo11 [Aspergillus affinis]KAI9041689.1 meiotic recombination protein spo11 [Aspergillus affinis]
MAPLHQGDPAPKDPVQNYIATTISAVLQELSSPNGRPAISINQKPQKKSCYINTVTGALETDDSQTRTINYTWPGKDAHEAWKFSILSWFQVALIDTQRFDSYYISHSRSHHRSDSRRLDDLEKQLLNKSKGKGYPDLCTRQFIRKLSESRRLLNDPLRFYALVDSDPDGMAIMSTYKYGSMAHTRDNAQLNIPCLRWLGLRTSDVAAGASPLGDDALIQLTPRDRKRSIAMLSSNPVWAADGPELEWRAELQQMLMLNLKAELEILYDRDGGIEEWIDRKMATADQ